MALMRAARDAAIAVMALTASTNPPPTQLEVRARPHSKSRSKNLRQTTDD